MGVVSIGNLLDQLIIYLNRLFSFAMFVFFSVRPVLMLKGAWQVVGYCNACNCFGRWRCTLWVVFAYFYRLCSKKNECVRELWERIIFLFSLILVSKPMFSGSRNSLETFLILDWLVVVFGSGCHFLPLYLSLWALQRYDSGVYAHVFRQFKSNLNFSGDKLQHKIRTTIKRGKQTKILPRHWTNPCFILFI